MNILLIDDDMDLKEIISNFFSDYNFDFFYAKNGAAGLRILSKIKPDIILLDLSLPDISGLEICRKVRTSLTLYGNPYIIIVSAYEDADHVVECFSSGADDYLKKPFDPRELLSHINTLKKRHKTPNTGFIEYKSLTIDLEKQLVNDNDLEIILTKKEYELLVYFLNNKGAVLDQSKIYSDVWQSVYYLGNKTVEQFLHKIKNKIPTFKENLINIKGFGYKLLI